MTNKQDNYFKKIKKYKNCISYYCNNSNLGKKGYIHFTNENKKTHKYYIIENIEFINGLYINADENISIMFKNCIFHKNIAINSLGEISFENNKYYSDANYPIFPEFFFTVKTKNLKFINETFSNNSLILYDVENIFGLNINTQFLTIDNSIIKVCDNNGNIAVDAEETIIFDSIIDSSKINLKTNDLYIYSSTILGEACVSIETKNTNNSEIAGIETPLFIYNGETVEKAKVFNI